MAFAEYTVDRLGVCIRNVTHVKGVAAERATNGNEILGQFEASLEELLMLLSSLQTQWQM